ncbi:hypothetical protein OCV73_10785 [Barnesiella propionica]|uniref:hypothetical protein n=1 Tax=Barnesiella propionica TaxID=2981781 RepID=UPI0011CA779D|nr:hypothetical protein [Barnesiella propionica]MCU6769423.1 hypothetical protein [Barnesiella propionica]
MSSQINFYALPEDRPAFKQWLEEREILVIGSRTKNINPIPFLDIADEENWQVHLLLKKWLPVLHFRYEKDLNCFFLKNYGNQTVEFNLPHFLGDKLMQCRLYYQKGDFNKAGQWVDFDEDFLKWAAKLFRDFKKEFLIRFENRGYKNYATREFLRKFENHELGKVEFLL